MPREIILSTSNLQGTKQYFGYGGVFFLWNLFYGGWSMNQTNNEIKSKRDSTQI